MQKFIPLLACGLGLVQGILQPQSSESRDIRSLDGIWNFRLGDSLDPEQGFREQWYLQPLSQTGPVMDMPVPSSFNDITTDVKVRDHSGWVWYDRQFFTPGSWDLDKNVDVFLRFGSVHYSARVWLNGVQVMTHEGGHLPFETDVSAILRAGEPNLLIVAVNNTLTPSTVPQGYWRWKTESGSYPAGYFTNYYTFDFFNYAGIHRPVLLYTVPKTLHVADISVVTSVSPDLTMATLTYNVEVESETDDFGCEVKLLDKDLQIIGSNQQCSGSMEILIPNLWWPRFMSSMPGYLHTFEVAAFNSGQEDRYRLNVGLREVTWSNTTFKINHRDFYFRGLGMHEDANIRGKGLDLARIAKDFNLLQWLNANSFRTSHYPYAEEIMDFADRNGFVVIDECPGVNLEIYDQPLLENHLKVMDELIARDRNRPSVVMWSIANEPRSDTSAARDYFQAVADHTRSLDPTRPTTYATFISKESDRAAYAVDIIMINRYASWYTDTGHLELIQRQLTSNIRGWNEKHGKLIMVSEYGADTIHGFHELPSTIWTEEYQTDLMLQFFQGFDTLRSEGILIGEMIWNFADFMTIQEYKRAWGNRKGVFTRDRHPKSSAHLLRSRYGDLASTLENVIL